MKIINLHGMYSFSRLLMLVGLSLLVAILPVTAQDAASSPVEKERARLSLSYLNINNLGTRLIATVKTKVDRSYEAVPGVEVAFYFGAKDEESKLGTAVSNDRGEAILLLPEKIWKTVDALNHFIYLAAIEDNENYEDAEDEIEIWRSQVALELEEEDSIKIVRFWVGEPDSLGEMVGLEDVDAMIYVQRLFGLLPISEPFESTDEDGFLEVEFPADIPGDEEGLVTIVAKVDDHDRFGSLSVSKAVNWGKPSVSSSEEVRRELWSSRANAPIYLIIVVNALILGIWGTLIHIISQIFKIRRLGLDD